MANFNLLSGKTLAYIGDSFYENEVRKHLINSGLTKVNDLHKEAILYTSSKGQFKIISDIMDELLEEELDIFKRGRNANGLKRKNSSQQEYNYATGFEALVGFLYLSNKIERLKFVLTKAFEIIESN